MTNPIEVKVDLEANASYVRYRQLLANEHVAETQDIVGDGSVAVDLDPRGAVLGIEVLGFAEDTLRTAEQVAKERDLAFPRSLAGVVPQQVRAAATA